MFRTGEHGEIRPDVQRGEMEIHIILNGLNLLEQRFKARYESYRLLRGRQDAALSWKRAWLDVKREIRYGELTQSNITKPSIPITVTREN